MKNGVIVAMVIAAFALTAVDDAAARTTVRVEGNVVIIHVPIWIPMDLTDAAQREFPGAEPTLFRNEDTGEYQRAQDLADYWAKQTESLWNAGFAKHRYGDCLTFRLEVEIVAAQRDFEPSPTIPPEAEGYHYIHVLGPSTTPMIFDPATNDPTEDTPSAFTRSLEGQIGTRGWPYAHEIGHLLGLGDDYDHETGAELSGREGTLMGGAGEVTQGLVDRIGKLIEQSGTKLPECWEGEVRYTITGHPTIALRFTGSARIAVGADESVDGSMRGRGVVTDLGGPHRFTSTCDIGGRREATSLALELQSCTSSSAAGGFSGAGGSLTLAISGTTARGSFSSFGYDSFEMRLRCVGCEGDG